MREHLLELLGGIIHWILPSTCLVCGRPLREGGFLCSECESNLKRHEIHGPHCYFCGAPLGREKICPFCHGKGLTVDRIAAPYWYREEIVKIVEAFKYNGLKGLHRVMATKMAETIKKFESIDYLVPIPLHKVRKRERGFSQTELLAQKLSQLTEIPVLKALKRVKNTKSQTALGKRERRENLREAFSLNRKISFTEKCIILLVDDVLTTGATLEEAAKVLKKGGAKRVHGILYAIAEPPG